MLFGYEKKKSEMDFFSGKPTLTLLGTSLFHGLKEDSQILYFFILGFTKIFLIVPILACLCIDRYIKLRRQHVTDSFTPLSRSKSSLETYAKGGGKRDKTALRGQIRFLILLINLLIHPSHLKNRLLCRPGNSDGSSQKRTLPRSQTDRNSPNSRTEVQRITTTKISHERRTTKLKDLWI
jgi:hypothetical protein